MKKAEAQLVPAGGGLAAYDFKAEHPTAQCVSIAINIEPGRELMVASILVAGVEQLIGGALPAAFLATMPLQLDRQRADDELTITLQNDGAIDAVAEVSVSFVPVEAITLSKSRLH